MSDQQPSIVSVKIEPNTNTLIQSYIDTFNKEITKSEPPIRHIEENANSLLKMDVQVTGIEPGDEIIENQNGTYFVDENGQYYFQADSHHVISSVNKVIKPDNEISMTEETMVKSGDNFQTVAIVPSENGEVSYVLIVQPGEKEQNKNLKLENDLNIYNEDLDDGNQNIEVDDDDKAKVTSTKKQLAITKLHMCSFCAYTTSKNYLLTRHLKSHSAERPHKCSVCGRGFKTLASLQNHENTHTRTKPFKCRYCNSAFTTSGERARHVMYIHTREKPHKCNECESAFVELSKLKRHARCHTGERPYQCPHCTYASPDTFKLKRHLRTHTGKKPYECEICHMRFNQSNSLKTHKLTHNIGEKPVFRCGLCPSTCGRKADLRIHIQKLHTSDKPLKCKRCGKSFPDRYNLKLHSKTHEGEKCFKCEICPYATSSLRFLSSHTLIHTNEKPFACETCDQKFRQKNLLKRHQNLHHNPEYISPIPKEKSHECRECGNLFRHKGNLIRHMVIHDPDLAVHEKSPAL